MNDTATQRQAPHLGSEGDEPAAADESLAAAAKALGHPVRVRILRVLLQRGTCQCGDLVDELPLAQSTVSQHLKVLKAAGLIVGRIDGPRVCYCAAPNALRTFVESAGALLAESTSLPPEEDGDTACCEPTSAST